MNACELRADPDKGPEVASLPALGLIVSPVCGVGEGVACVCVCVWLIALPLCALSARSRSLSANVAAAKPLREDPAPCVGVVDVGEPPPGLTAGKLRPRDTTAGDAEGEGVCASVDGGM